MCQVPLLSAWLVAILIFSQSIVSHSLPRVPISPSRRDCDLKNSSVEHYKDLVHKASIRGRDTREVSKSYKGTMLLVCNKQGTNKTSGSINLVEDSEALTVLHNVVDLETCKATASLGSCYIYDGKLLYPLKWKKDPVALCRENGGKDSVLVAEFNGPKPERPAYRVLCENDVDKEKLDRVKVIGSEAENFKSSQFRLGHSTIVGEGELYDIIKSEKTLKYENDTGAGTSGGAVVGTINGKEYLIGIHVGDHYGEEEEEILNSTGSLDGLPADKDTFYGQGLTLGAEISGCK